MHCSQQLHIIIIIIIINYLQNDSIDDAVCFITAKSILQYYSNVIVQLKIIILY